MVGALLRGRRCAIFVPTDQGVPAASVELRGFFVARVEWQIVTALPLVSGVRACAGSYPCPEEGASTQRA